jgi:hypothetical protein
VCVCVKKECRFGFCAGLMRDFQAPVTFFSRPEFLTPVVREEVSLRMD